MLKEKLKEKRLMSENLLRVCLLNDGSSGDIIINICLISSEIGCKMKYSFNLK